MIVINYIRLNTHFTVEKNSNNRRFRLFCMRSLKKLNVWPLPSDIYLCSISPFTKSKIAESKSEFHFFSCHTRPKMCESNEFDMVLMCQRKILSNGKCAIMSRIHTHILVNQCVYFLSAERPFCGALNSKLNLMRSKIVRT